MERNNRNKKRTQFFKKGKNIFSEGEPVNGLFFLYEGSAKIYMHWGDQKELILRFAKAGDILGYRGIGASNVYPISADVLEDSKKFVLSQMIFWRLY